MSLVIVVEESATARERCVAAIREAGLDALSASNIDQAMTLIDLLPTGGETLGIIVGTISGQGLLSFIKNKLAISDLLIEEHTSLASAVSALESRSAAATGVPPTPVIYKIYSTDDRRGGQPEELELMLTHFLNSYSRLYAKVCNGFTSAAMERLCAHDWPGGVRQVRDTVMTLVEASNGPQVTLQDLAALGNSELLTFSSPLGLSIKELNRRYALLVLELVGGNKSEASRILGVGVKTLQRRLSQWSDAKPAAEERDGGGL
jgi:DNA-binding NtrC family response regulator